MEPPQKQERRVEDYLNGFFSRQLKEQQVIELPETSFTLLAASRKTEEARELIVEEKTYGAFTKTLLDELQNNNGNISYQELMLKTQTVLFQQSQAQQSELYTTSDTPGNRVFLSHLKTGTVEHQVHYSVYHHDGKWLLELGLLEEYESGSTFRHTPLELSLNGQVVGTARTSSITLDQCEVEPEFSADPSQIYQAKIDWQRNTRLAVYVESEGQSIANLVNWLAQQAAPGFRLTDDEEAANYRVEVRSPQAIELMDRNRLIHTFTAVDENENFQQLSKALQHIAKWRNISEFENPYTVQKSDSFQIALERRDIKTSAVRPQHDLEVIVDKAGTSLPYTFSIEGGADEGFYYTALLLGADFSIQMVQTGEYRSEGVEEDVDLHFAQVGQQFFKVIFSSDPIRSDLLSMPPLSFSETAGSGTR